MAQKHPSNPHHFAQKVETVMVHIFGNVPVAFNQILWPNKDHIEMIIFSLFPYISMENYQFGEHVFNDSLTRIGLQVKLSFTSTWFFAHRKAKAISKRMLNITDIHGVLIEL